MDTFPSSVFGCSPRLRYSDLAHKARQESEGSEKLGDLLGVESTGVVLGKVAYVGGERVGGPGERFRVGVGAGDRGEQLLVATDSAAVLRRGGSSPGEAAWCDPAAFLAPFLYNDRVSPVVAEVVDVVDLVANVGDPGQPDPFGPALGPAVVRSVVFAAHREHVQMGVGPGERNLDHRMQAFEGDRVGHEQSSPDRRPGTVQADLQHQRASRRPGLSIGLSGGSACSRLRDRSRLRHGRVQQRVLPAGT